MENNKSKRVKCLFCKQIEFITNDPVSFENKQEVEEYILENWNNKR